MSKKILFPIVKDQVLAASQVGDSDQRVIQIEGQTFVVYKGVFAPDFSPATTFLVKHIPIRKGEVFLEIGTGTGILSIFAILRGAVKGIATDINPAAVENAAHNFGLYELGQPHNDKLTILEGNLFEPVEGLKFDHVFWNPPFNYEGTDNPTALEKAIIDPGYKDISRFLQEVPKYLNPEGRISLSFSPTIGRQEKLEEAIEAAGLTSTVIASSMGAFRLDGDDQTGSTLPVRFEVRNISKKS